MGWEHPDDRDWREQLEEWEDTHGPVGVGWPAEHVGLVGEVLEPLVRERNEEMHAAMLDIHAGDVPLVTGVFAVDDATGVLHAMPDNPGRIDGLLVIEETVGPDA